MRNGEGQKENGINNLTLGLDSPVLTQSNLCKMFPNWTLHICSPSLRMSYGVVIFEFKTKCDHFAREADIGAICEFKV